jgi:hypothetical protein
MHATSRATDHLTIVMCRLEQMNEIRIMAGTS